MQFWKLTLKEKQINRICEFVFGEWNWLSIMKDSQRGCRIIVGWDANEVNVMQLHSSNQAILCQIEIKDTRESFFCCFVYASNSGKDIKVL